VFRHPLSSSVVLAALLATAATLTVARPSYHPAIQVENVDLGSEAHYSTNQVRAAFALHGLVLDHSTTGGELTTLGTGSAPWDESALYVNIFPDHGTLGLGHGDWEKGVYERRVGNVLVHYGGFDDATLVSVRAAIASLAPFRPVPKPW
jgi:hypothetical protein